jgi:hypothetical protein
MGYGFRPVQMAGSAYNTGGFLEVPINMDNVTTDIFNGECVTFTANKGIDRLTDSVSNAETTAGVCVGARWETASGDVKWGQFYDGAAGNTEVYIFVVPVRDTIFRVQSDASWDANQLGDNCNTTGTSGSTTTGNSDLKADVGDSTNNPPLRVVGVIEDGRNELSTTDNPDILVRFLDGSIQDILG